MKAQDLQQGLFTRLSTDAGLVAALSSIWGFVPIFADVPEVDGDNDAYFPYVSFGPDTLTQWDDKDINGANATVQINVWTRSGNYTQAKTIAGLIYNRLHHQQFAIAGATNITTMCESQAFTLDPDGHTRRGLLFFRVLYDF
jgi:hypothetical protein